MRNHRPAVRPEPAFPIRLMALDIDGTLVGPDVRLSPRIRAAIAGAVERGVRVSLATGRRPVSAVGFANQLGLSEPIIAHQGAVIRAMPKRREEVLSDIVPQRGRVGRLLYHRPMEPDVIRDALAWCLGHGLDAHINDLEEILAAVDDPRFEDYSSYYGSDATFVADLVAAVDRPMTKVISVGEPPAPMRLIGEARRLFAGRASPTVSHPRFLEFVADGVSKGRAVAWLAHRAGIPLGQVMTIGDALNDLEMIADAGHGTAMVSSPVELWPSARYLAGPVEEDGAAALIEALVLAPPDEAARNAARLAEAAREHRRAVLGSDAADVTDAADAGPDAADAGPDATDLTLAADPVGAGPA